MFYNLLYHSPNVWQKEVVSRCLFWLFIFLGFLFCFVFAILFPFITEASLLNVKEGGTGPGVSITMPDLVEKEVERHLDTGQPLPGHGDNSWVLHQSSVKPPLSLSYFFHLDGVPQAAFLASLRLEMECLPWLVSLGRSPFHGGPAQPSVPSSLFLAGQAPVWAALQWSSFVCNRVSSLILLSSNKNSL